MVQGVNVLVETAGWREAVSIFELGKRQGKPSQQSKSIRDALTVSTRGATYAT